MSDKVIIDRYCPKCMSNRVYTDDDFYACRQCGNRWIPNFKPITKTEDEEMAIKGTCKNCGRSNLTLPYRGMCGGCYNRIKQMEWDSPECKAALAQAKKDFNNPDYKQVHHSRTKTKKHTPQKPPKNGSSEDGYLKHINAAKSHVKATGFKHSDDPDTAVVIQLIDVQIAEYVKRIDKLNQAKKILL